MRTLCLSFFIVSACTVAAAGRQAAPAQEETQVFRAHSDLVVLHVNVFDGRSDAVPDLPQQAFSVFEDGTPQEISFFANTDVPVAAGLVLDNSGSMITRHGMVVAGSTAFADASHPQDELFAVVFNENVRFGLPPTVAFTTNRVLLRGSVARFPPGGKTALYDAVVAALDHLENATHQKRVLVVLSDGEDNASRLSEADMLEKARRGNTIIYTVSSATAGTTDGNGDRRVLRRLADVSGGVAYFPRDEAEVVQTFEEIAGNIRRGYSIGYVPTNTGHDGGFRRVQVRVRIPDRNNLTVRARDGYLSSSHTTGH
jgi:Ca-activated chloride channel family protein